MLIGQLTNIDNEELERELAELMGTSNESSTTAGTVKQQPDVIAAVASDVASSLPEVPNTPVLPAVPSGTVTIESTSVKADSEKVDNTRQAVSA